MALRRRAKYEHGHPRQTVAGQPKYSYNVRLQRSDRARIDK